MVNSLRWTEFVLYGNDVVQSDCGKSMENRLKHITGQRTFSRLSKMPVVTLYSSFKQNWKEKGKKYRSEN